MKRYGCVLLVVFLALFANQSKADDGGARNRDARTLVVQWNAAALQGVRDSKIGPPMVARALAIVHTCIYDAWAAYDEHALGTRFGDTLRASSEANSRANKRKAISFAAYRAAVNLFPDDRASVFDPLMAQLGYDPNDTSQDTTTAAGIGNVACQAVLDLRHDDGANQYGDLHPGAYSNYTEYAPVNTPDAINNPDHWQPLRFVDGTGTLITQTFLGHDWNKVIPFALKSDDQFRAKAGQSGPALFGSAEYIAQANEIIELTAHLTDRQKMIAEYWKDGPNSETPPGHWSLFAQFVSARDHHGLDEDVKMFFALTNAELDASIAAWDAKIFWDSVRPVTAIRFLYAGQQIPGWAGPFKGTVAMDGANWIPYQPVTFPTPPFSEYISGHSIFSAAGAEVLRHFTGSDRFGSSVTFAAGSSAIEPGAVPAQPLTLFWSTFTVAANEAGMSRRYGGIHFRLADLVSRSIGRDVGEQAWSRAQSYWNGKDD